MALQGSQTHLLIREKNHVHTHTYTHNDIKQTYDEITYIHNKFPTYTLHLYAQTYIHFSDTHKHAHICIYFHREMCEPLQIQRNISETIIQQIKLQVFSNLNGDPSTSPLPLQGLGFVVHLHEPRHQERNKEAENPFLLIWQNP